MQTGSRNIIPRTRKSADVYTLLNCLNAGILLIGPASEILFCNKASLAILAITEKELLSRKGNFLRLDIISEDGSSIDPADYPSVQALKSRQPIENQIIGVYRASRNDRVWLQVNAIPVTCINGDITEVMLSFTDITEHKAAKDKLTALYQHLEIRAFEIATANSDLEKFVYAATHDLQEPLRLISSFVQLLENKYRDQLDEQAQQYIHFAVEGSKRMKKLIMDLLEYSKFTGSGMILTATDLNKLLDKVRHSMKLQLEEANAVLVTGPMPVAQVHPSLLVQLFENLVDNALKYRAQDKPYIEISCEEKEGHWQFCVNDNGIGISQGYTEKVFDLFHRLHNAGTYDGTGVGLAICQKIVRLHRGKIWVVSVPGKGSAFYFTIPLVILKPYGKI